MLFISLHYKILNLSYTRARRHDLKQFQYTVQLYCNKYPKGKFKETTGNWINQE
jgi:hypothetical protein